MAALPQALDSALPPSSTRLAPGELIRSQQGDSDLAPYFARVGDGEEEVDGREEFMLSISRNGADASSVKPNSRAFHLLGLQPLVK